MLSDSFHVLGAGLEGYTETQEVDALIELIHNKDNQLLMYIETICSTMSYNYTGAVQLLCNMVVKHFRRPINRPETVSADSALVDLVQMAATNTVGMVE